MKYEKFYEFVQDVAKEDPKLMESIITAHAVIFENEEALLEGKFLAGAAKAALPALLYGIMQGCSGTMPSPDSLGAPPNKEMSAQCEDYKDKVIKMAEELLVPLEKEFVQKSSGPRYSMSGPLSLESYQLILKAYVKLFRANKTYGSLFASTIDQKMGGTLGDMTENAIKAKLITADEIRAGQHHM